MSRSHTLRSLQLAWICLLMASAGTSLSAQTEASQPVSTAVLDGIVQHNQGGPAVGIRVALTNSDAAQDRAALTDDTGAFSFAGLPAGTYRVQIAAAGLEPYTSEPITLAAGENKTLPLATLHIAAKTTTVNVVATLDDVAEAQVKQQETQRVLGVLPNFYTTYIWDAAPLTPKLKFGLALRSVVDPTAFLVTAGVAGVEHAQNTFPGYRQEFTGYARRYGASYADTVTGRMLGSAVFPTLFHQDPRYFYKGSGTFRSRLLYALVSTVVARGDNGRLQPNYSHLLGSFAAAGLSNLYRSPIDRQPSLTFQNGLIITAGNAAMNVFREFFSRNATPNIPTFANGKQ